MKSEIQKLISEKQFNMPLDRRRLQGSPANLWQKMVLIAEQTVRYNWHDVAIFDRLAVEQMPKNGAAVWIIYEFGSYFCPTYESVADDDHSDSLIYFALVRLMSEDENKQLSDYLKSTVRFFLVLNKNKGEITELTENQLFAFVKNAA